MNIAEFEAAARNEGYEVHQGEIKPNEYRHAHAHEFDARLFILDGHLALTRDGDCQTFGPGDTCNVPSGTAHEERTGADGVRYLAARRPRIGK